MIPAIRSLRILFVTGEDVDLFTISINSNFFSLCRILTKFKSSTIQFLCIIITIDFYKFNIRKRDCTLVIEVEFIVGVTNNAFICCSNRCFILNKMSFFIA